MPFALNDDVPRRRQNPEKEDPVIESVGRNVVVRLNLSFLATVGDPPY